MYKKTSYIIQGGQKRYEIIDFLKGFSIMTIVLMHFIQGFMPHLPGTISVAASLGGSGVHVFIVCSGFGLYLSYLNKPLKFGEFIKIRFMKVYVPYILIVLVSALIPYMYAYSDRGGALLSHIFLYKMFIPKYEESFGGQLWFVSTIIQFYIVFLPLCFLKKKLNNNKLLLGLGLIGSVLFWVMVACLGKENIRVWNSFFLQYLWEFVLGMCLAEVLYYRKNITVSRIVLWILTPIGILAMGITSMLGDPIKLFNDIPALIGYGGIGLCIYFFGSSILNNLFIKIANISYELFLVHILIGKTIYVWNRNRINNLSKEILMVVVIFIASILIAYLYHKLLQTLRTKRHCN